MARARRMDRPRAPLERAAASWASKIPEQFGRRWRLPPAPLRRDDDSATWWLRSRRRSICPLSDGPKPHRPPRHLGACPSLAPALVASDDRRVPGARRLRTARWGRHLKVCVGGHLLCRRCVEEPPTAWRGVGSRAPALPLVHPPRGRRREVVLALGDDDAVLLDLVEQGPVADLQQLGRPGAIAVGLDQRAADQILLGPA
jgi:hypothetical protein